MEGNGFALFFQCVPIVIVILIAFVLTAIMTILALPFGLFYAGCLALSHKLSHGG